MKWRYLLCLACSLWFALPVFGAELGLEWDANSETNLAGYEVYYDTDGSGPPYDGKGQAEGDSPIDVKNVTEFWFRTIDLKANNFWFVVTAYNTEGLESGYSNEVNTVPPSNPINLKGGVK